MSCTISKVAVHHNPDVIEDRLEQFTDLGFTVEEAKKLAEAQRADRTYWRVGQVEAMINHPDCDHALAVELIT